MKHRVRIITSLAFAALLATQPGGSCVTDSTSGAGTGSTTPVPQSSSTTPPPPPAPTADPNYVPSRADIVQDGRGVLTWVADADGTAYVQDVHRETTIVSHRIHRGETITVSPDDNRVRINNDKISTVDIKSDAEHRIYILRDRRFDDRDPRGGDPRGGYGAQDDGALPARVEQIDEGKGRPLSTWVQHDGRMYVYDVDARRVCTSVQVFAGQRFVFSPADDKITLNGDAVSTKNFSPKTNYRLYLGAAR